MVERYEMLGEGGTKQELNLATSITISVYYSNTESMAT
jgi:hypothetical protein